MDCHHPDQRARSLLLWESKNSHFQEDNDSYFISCQKSSKKEKHITWKILKAVRISIWPLSFRLTRAHFFQEILMTKYWYSPLVVWKPWHWEPKAICNIKANWNLEGWDFKTATSSTRQAIVYLWFLTRKVENVSQNPGCLLMRASSRPLLWHSG